MSAHRTDNFRAHTPGPWRSQGWVPTWAYIPVHDARHNLVASLYPDIRHDYSLDKVEANARLIAAAPDMLALLVWLDRKGGLGIDVHERIQATIDKAQG